MVAGLERNDGDHYVKYLFGKEIVRIDRCYVSKLPYEAKHVFDPCQVNIYLGP
jgi:hypothetical protein